MKFKEKAKNFTALHRLTRKQKIIRNVIVIVFCLVATVGMLENYKAENTVERVVEKWTEDQFFGEAEIYSEFTYAEGKKKIVYIGKETTEGDNFEAYLTLELDNPFKWVIYGSAMFNAPIVYDAGINTVITDLGDNQWEIKNYGSFIEANMPSVWKVRIWENENRDKLIDVNSMINFAYYGKVGEEGAGNEFTVNLQTGEVSNINNSPCKYDENDEWYQDYSGGTLEISESRMRFMAEKLIELIEGQK